MFENVRDIIAEELYISKNHITMDSHLSKDLCIDSIDMVDIYMTIEDELDINILDQEFDKWLYIRDIVDYLNKYM